MSDSKSLPANLPRGEIIRRARVLKGVSQRELARRSGIHYSSLCKYEKGRKVPRQSTVERALAALDSQVPHSSSLAPRDRQAHQPLKSRQGPHPPISFDPATKAELLCGIAQTVEQMMDLALSRLALAPGHDLAQPSGASQQRERQVDLPFAAANNALWSPGFCLLLCAESEKSAADDADEARDVAMLARTVACRLRREEPHNRFFMRLEGRTEGSLANALRVAGDHASAEEAFARARRLWKAGTDDAGLLSEAHMLHLEASLRRDQRRFPEALRLHARAWRKARPEEAGAILLNQSATEVHMGAYEAALLTLAKAAPHVNGASQPRLWFGLRYNQAMCLFRLDRADEAEPLLGEVRRLALQLGNGLDLIGTRFLEGLVDAGRGRTDTAIATLEKVCSDLDKLGHPYDFALGGLDLALLYREEGRWTDIRELADRMIGIFHERQIHRETIAAVILFQEAAEKEGVTVELVRRLQEYLKQAQTQPGLRFEL